MQKVFTFKTLAPPLNVNILARTLRFFFLCNLNSAKHTNFWVWGLFKNKPLTTVEAHENT